VLKLEDKPMKYSPQQLKSHFGQYYLNLQHVCKPHNLAVTCMAIDPSGELLASGVSCDDDMLCCYKLLCSFVSWDRVEI